MLYQSLFPQLADKKWVEVNLNALAEKAFPIETYPENPLLDPAECGRMLAEVAEILGADYTYGGYLEDRRHLWRGHYQPQDECVHLGIDFNVPAGTIIHAPSEGIIWAFHNDQDQNGGWGNKVYQRLKDERYYVIYGHLSDKQDFELGDKVMPGDPIGIVGNPNENGGWFPHLHVQIGVLPPLHDPFIVDGYGKMLDNIREVFPDPNIILAS